MEQLSLFENKKIPFPVTHDDIVKLHEQYIAEGETDSDAFTWSDTKNGRSYFFYGKKAFEHIIDSKGKAKLKIQQDDDKPIMLTSDSSNLLLYLEKLKEMKNNIFRNLNTDTFGCCNDFIHCSDALECLHQNDRFYNGCMYRKNLEAGKVFYGKNKNI